LDIDSLQSSAPQTLNYRQNNIPPVRSQPSAFASEDPWNTGRFNPGPSNVASDVGGRGNTNGAPSNLFGSGMPKDWWKKQEKVTITILGQQGFILNRYTVYEVATDVRIPT
jgi:sorting nexin-8